MGFAHGIVMCRVRCTFSARITCLVDFYQALGQNSEASHISSSALGFMRLEHLQIVGADGNLRFLSRLRLKRTPVIESCPRMETFPPQMMPHSQTVSLSMPAFHLKMASRASLHRRAEIISMSLRIHLLLLLRSTHCYYSYHTSDPPLRPPATPLTPILPIHLLLLVLLLLLLLLGIRIISS